jgi:hypothetical protein
MEVAVIMNFLDVVCYIRIARVRGSHLYKKRGFNPAEREIWILNCVIDFRAPKVSKVAFLVFEPKHEFANWQVVGGLIFIENILYVLPRELIEIVAAVKVYVDAFSFSMNSLHEIGDR